MIQFWKGCRWKLPVYLSEKFEILENGIVMTDEPRLLLTSETFRWKTTSRWNNLPMELRTELRLKRFKLDLKKWIRDRREVQDELEPD